MPEESILSASRIGCYESCSWKFWCTYTLKLPRTKNHGNVRGNACHLALECLLHPRRSKYVAKLKKTKTITSIPSIAKLVSDYLSKNGFYNEENFELCDKWICFGLTLDFKGGKGAKIDKPEEEFFLDTTKSEEGPKYKLTGFIDKPIQYPKEGKLKIVDYKTNKDKFTESQIESNTQAMCYILAAKQIWPDLKDVSVEFQFLKFDEDPFITVKFDQNQLEGYEYYLEWVFNKANSFTEEDAVADMAASKPFPKDGSFSGPLSCGFAEYPGHLKKDGSPRWHCEHKFPYDYYALVNKNGDVLVTSKDKNDLIPEKNQKVVKKKYQGCPAHCKKDEDDFPI